jgi:hypothetical protein
MQANTFRRIILSKIDVANLLKAGEAHEKEAELFQDSVKDVLNEAVDGITIDRVCLTECGKGNFGINIMGKFAV